MMIMAFFDLEEDGRGNWPTSAKPTKKK